MRVYWQLQELLARDVPVVWVVTPDELQLASSKLLLPDRPTEGFVMMAIRHWELRD